MKGKQYAKLVAARAKVKKEPGVVPCANCGRSVTEEDAYMLTATAPYCSEACYENQHSEGQK